MTIIKQRSAKVAKSIEAHSERVFAQARKNNEALCTGQDVETCSSHGGVCACCGSVDNNVTITAPWTMSLSFLGDIVIPDVLQERCYNCGPTMWLVGLSSNHISDYVNSVRDSRIAKLPVTEFITRKSVKALLGPAFPKHSHRLHNFMYCIRIDGVWHWYRPSVVAYKETGDGRLPLLR